MSLKTVALVGRPNVGKSTLFNRLVGRRSALVHDKPGVTRDRKEGVANLYGLEFRVIDTPGLFDPNTDNVATFLIDGMRHQALSGVEEADVILFIIDGRQGCTPYDHDLAEHLRRQKKPVLVVVNKCEGNQGIQGITDAAVLNLSDHIIPVSAEHGEGMADLAAFLTELIPDALEEELNDTGADSPIKLAIMGRPNVGKSTLVNSLIGEDRQLTGDMPGLTRDAITIPFDYDGRALLLIDTAGIRKNARISESLEKLSVMDATRTLKYAEVVVLVIDASTNENNPLERQDLHLAEMIAQEGRALILALNKWDLIKDQPDFLKRLHNQLSYNLPQVDALPVVPISAIRGYNLKKLMASVFEIYELWNKRLSTGELNRWFSFAIDNHAPPTVSGRRIKLKYITQIKSRPPTFVVFGTKNNEVPESYKRYLINRMREDLNMPGVPIRIMFRSPKNPYEEK
jgi:GTP-binding protein